MIFSHFQHGYIVLYFYHFGALSPSSGPPTPFTPWMNSQSYCIPKHPEKTQAKSSSWKRKMELHKGLTRWGCCKGDSQLGPAVRFVEGVGFQWYPSEHPDEASRKLQVGVSVWYTLERLAYPSCGSFLKIIIDSKVPDLKTVGGYWIVLRRVSCSVGWSSSPRSWALYLWTISAWKTKTGKAGSCWVACDRWILKRGWAQNGPCMNVAWMLQPLVKSSIDYGALKKRS